VSIETFRWKARSPTPASLPSLPNQRTTTEPQETVSPISIFLFSQNVLRVVDAKIHILKIIAIANFMERLFEAIVGI
jgi:hypothetical protein